MTPRRRGLAIAAPRTKRTIRAPFLAHDILYAKEPRIRFGWIQRCNPVATYPDSTLCDRALRSLRFLVVVDAFLTDTAACAHLVLPPALMLECEDLVASFGHHYLGLARRVVAPPGEARSDLEIAQTLARRLGLQRAVAGSLEIWVDRLLAPLSLSRQDLAAHAIRRPNEPTVAFAGRHFATPSGRVNLITELPPPADEGAIDGYPLHLLTVAPLAYQASQIPPAHQGSLPEVFAHPEAAGVADRRDGAEVRVRTRIGVLATRLRLDPAMRRDTLLMYRGGWVRYGRGVNVIVAARQTRHGGQAGYLDELARLE
jgi:anaerobic selenocysteine-containing dehydrogenase